MSRFKPRALAQSNTAGAGETGFYERFGLMLHQEAADIILEARGNLMQTDLPKESVISTLEGYPLPGTPRTNDLVLQGLPDMRGLNSPMLAVIVTVIGALLVGASFIIQDTQLLVRSSGTALLLLVLLVLISETLLARAAAKRLLATKLMPMVAELASLRAAISDYLVELDRRTSRYFHAVTNSKVTAYFMLRQLEQALQLLCNDLEKRAERPSASNYNYIKDKLRGTVDYRDGFAVNSGRLYHTPVPRVATVIQELIHELEAGVGMIEDEIRTLMAQPPPFDTGEIPDIRQLDLPLRKE